MNKNNKQFPILEYSNDYKLIKAEIESNWPSWKINVYNSKFATSVHAHKINKNQNKVY